MAQILLTYQARVVTVDGRAFVVRARGEQREDGLWEGWLEFLPDDGGVTLATGRETTQPNLTDLEYWATGLTPVYLEGALERAVPSNFAA